MIQGLRGILGILALTLPFYSQPLFAINCEMAKDENIIRVSGHGNIVVAPGGSSSHSDLKFVVLPPEPSKWDDGETAIFSSEEIFTHIGEISGDGVIYSGPANPGWLLYGPYYEVSGKTVGLQPTLTISTDWEPEQYEYCSHHEYNMWTGVRKCVERSIGNYETSFNIELAIDSGKKVIFSHTLKNFNQLNEAEIKFPLFICDGNVKEIEVAINGLTGGNLRKFQVHRVKIESWWNYH